MGLIRTLQSIVIKPGKIEPRETRSRAKLCKIKGVSSVKSSVKHDNSKVVPVVESNEKKEPVKSKASSPSKPLKSIQNKPEIKTKPKPVPSEISKIAKTRAQCNVKNVTKAKTPSVIETERNQPLKPEKLVTRKSLRIIGKSSNEETNKTLKDCDSALKQSPVVKSPVSTKPVESPSSVNTRSKQSPVIGKPVGAKQKSKNACETEIKDVGGKSKQAAVENIPTEEDIPRGKSAEENIRRDETPEENVPSVKSAEVKDETPEENVPIVKAAEERVHNVSEENVPRDKTTEENVARDEIKKESIPSPLIGCKGENAGKRKCVRKRPDGLGAVRKSPRVQKLSAIMLEIKKTKRRRPNKKNESKEASGSVQTIEVKNEPNEGVVSVCSGGQEVIVNNNVDLPGRYEFCNFDVLTELSDEMFVLPAPDQTSVEQARSNFEKYQQYVETFDETQLGVTELVPNLYDSVGNQYYVKDADNGEYTLFNVGDGCIRVHSGETKIDKAECSMEYLEVRTERPDVCTVGTQQIPPGGSNNTELNAYGNQNAALTTYTSNDNPDRCYRDVTVGKSQSEDTQSSSIFNTVKTHFCLHNIESFMDGCTEYNCNATAECSFQSQLAFQKKPPEIVYTGNSQFVVQDLTHSSLDCYGKAQFVPGKEASGNNCVEEKQNMDTVKSVSTQGLLLEPEVKKNLSMPVLESIDMELDGNLADSYTVYSNITLQTTDIVDVSHAGNSTLDNNVATKINDIADAETLTLQVLTKIADASTSIDKVDSVSGRNNVKKPRKKSNKRRSGKSEDLNETVSIVAAESKQPPATSTPNSMVSTSTENNDSQRNPETPVKVDETTQTEFDFDGYSKKSYRRVKKVKSARDGKPREKFKRHLDGTPVTRRKNVSPQTSQSYTITEQEFESPPRSEYRIIEKRRRKSEGSEPGTNEYRILNGCGEFDSAAVAKNLKILLKKCSPKKAHPPNSEKVPEEKVHSPSGEKTESMNVPEEILPKKSTHSPSGMKAENVPEECSPKRTHSPSGKKAESENVPEKTSTKKTHSPNGQKSPTAYIPEEILSVARYKPTPTTPEQLVFLVKWIDRQEPSVVPSALAKVKWPQIVIQFYESLNKFYK